MCAVLPAYVSPDPSKPLSCAVLMACPQKLLHPALCPWPAFNPTAQHSALAYHQLLHTALIFGQPVTPLLQASLPSTAPNGRATLEPPPARGPHPHPGLQLSAD